MLAQLSAFYGQVHLIYGNNTGDQQLITAQCATVYDYIRHHGFHADIQAGALRIALIHYPELARAIALSGVYDLVCCGHNHVYAVERLGRSLLLNPGDLLGKDAEPALAVLDTADGSVRRIIAGERLVFND